MFTFTKIINAYSFGELSKKQKAKQWKANLYQMLYIQI